ncbi:Unknown protein [Striga hermonthica]|uniref:Coiled-coil domain-containing protein R3HCC1L n=1 Tax=Striga hermonthica TaxID=68872 RepID=A0A9N7RBG1_STRHE|nr:Unknown protein [Striga hermonthica]
MDGSGGATTGNWTEMVEDLVHSGEIDRAVSFLESIIPNLENEVEKEQLQNKNGEKSGSGAADRLCTALEDLSRLYAAQGLSLRADQTQSRALQIKLRKLEFGVRKGSTSNENAEDRISQDGATTLDGIAEDGFSENSENLHSDGIRHDSGGCLPGISKLSLEESKSQQTKRRGRGTFAYKKQGLYSDNPSDEPIIDDDSENNSVGHAEDPEKRNLLYGTRHVLVLADFPPSTRTTDLEKLLKKFKDLFVIRWVNDTTAILVFRTPAAALEASHSIECPFTVRALEEDDELLSAIPPKDLEPPRRRPQTSARTAQRLIAHSMGIKLPSTFGSSELRKQEEARKNRIVSRQNMRDDAWGSDDTN